MQRSRVGLDAAQPDQLKCEADEADAWAPLLGRVFTERERGPAWNSVLTNELEPEHSSN